MKISRANRYALFPKPLLESDVPPEILFRLQRLERSRSGIKAKDLVLAARRTEARCYARMQRRVGLVDLVIICDLIRANIAELIEMSYSSTRDIDQIVDRRIGRLDRSSTLLRLVAYNSPLWSKL